MNEKKEILSWLSEIVAEILNLPAREIDVATHIQNLGFTSTHLIQLVDKLTENLGEEIHPGVFFEHTSLDAFAQYLLTEKPGLAEKFLMKTARHTNGTPVAEFVGSIHRNDSGADSWSTVNPEFFAGTSRMSATEKVQQSSMDGMPVIIGGGIGAMLISKTLTAKKIKHLVIGKPLLGDTPKLGESMTESVSIEFTRNFKEYSDYFFPKEVTPFYMGKIVSGLRFGFFKTFASLFVEDGLPEAFIHIDRIGFDQALYEEVRHSDQATWIDQLVKDVDYCEKTDTVRALILDNGQTIVPSFAWDCTNHVRLLGRKLKIPHKDFDAPRRVFFTHYYKKNPNDKVPMAEAPWMHATSLLNAEPGYDGISGVSWLIPLGDYISVGVSIAETDIGNDTPEEVITKLTRAYQRRGVDYSSKFFPRRKEIVVVPSQHYMYDRFVGKNWALVGGSAANTWFTSGSNISMLCCMGCMADLILKEPEIYGEHYSRHVRGYAGTQEVYDTLLDSQLGPIDSMKFLSRIVEQGRKRISSFYMFRAGLNTEVAKTASELWSEKVVVDKAYLEFLRQLATHAMPEDRSQQMKEIFAKFEEMKKRDEKVTIPYLKNNPVRSRKPELFLKT